MIKQKFGKWIIIDKAPDRRGEKYWLCQCECGNTSEVYAFSLKYGSSTQCKSCAKKGKAPRLTHNMTHSREYDSWQSMKTRCYNSNHKFYNYYGGRGIRVCRRWKNSFENFYADMGKRPLGRSLDRINTNGNYEPSNCKWATPKEQMRNRR